MEPNFLLFGKSGWIGSQVAELLKSEKANFQCSSARLEDRVGIESDLDRVKPTHVLLAAGLVGKPNVDWCEDHKEEVIRVNVIGCLNVADICNARGIHLTFYSTGCIFYYDEAHAMGSGIGFTEEDKPNFIGSFYAETKAYLENLMRVYSNLLILRIRMPLVADFFYPRNLITKLLLCEKVVNIPNSISVLPELLPISIEMAKQRIVGVMNFTNPGAICHNEILQLYKDNLDEEFGWTNFSLDEQANVVTAPRSNNHLDTTKLQELFPQVLPIAQSILNYAILPNVPKKQELKEGIRKLKEAKLSASTKMQG